MEKEKVGQMVEDLLLLVLKRRLPGVHNLSVSLIQVTQKYQHQVKNLFYKMLD